MLQNSRICCVPKRYAIVFMIFLGYAIMTCLHTNLAMTVVEMTTLKNVSNQNGYSELKAEFNWTPQEKGLVLSSYSYGRLLCPLGGLLAGKLGGSTIYAIGYLVMSLVTFFTPVLLSVNFTLFFIIYVIFGIFESFIFSGVPDIFSRWAPPNERSKFVSFGVSGFYVGTVASFAISGWVLTNYNWQKLFYGSGLVSFAWTLIWFAIVRNDPAKDKFISESELKYIQDELKSGDVEQKLTYPWKRIFTSAALWIAALSEFAIVCGYVFSTMFLPQYIKDINNFDIEKIGYISTLPHICSIISMPICGCVCDYIRSHKIISITNIHRIVAGIGLFIAVLSYAVVPIWTNVVVDIVAISVFQFFSTFVIIDLNVFILDFAPKYSAFMMSVINSIATSSGVVVPILVASIVTSASLSQWNTCFVVFSIMYLIAAIFYLIFVSEEQPLWVNSTSTTENKQSQEKREDNTICTS
ncbi:vesicular glutamate transporter 2-like [Planococcus citri]|uniref:vesicular glutamate transporter 2-like n=1 Tax=Planococcus citri TaxID=170843 RepID=UPI0031F903A2